MSVTTSLVRPRGPRADAAVRGLGTEITAIRRLRLSSRIPAARRFDSAAEGLSQRVGSRGSSRRPPLAR